MRIVFMGTPTFAVPSLSALAERHDVIAVYTRPDAASGRGRTLSPSPVKVAAVSVGLPVEQPRTLRDPEVVSRLQSYRPDAIVVAAFGMILPAEVLSVPPSGCINVHASLLPRWRGAAPIQRAILAGDAVAGVSIMRMEEGLDTGPYAEQVSTEVDDLDATELTDALARLGAEALLRTLTRVEDGADVWTPQDEEAATYARKLTAADVALDPSLGVEAALRRVRASGPSAPCRATVGGRRIVVVEVHRSDHVIAPGHALCARGLTLGFADGAIELDRIVPEGRSAMSADAFARGARLGDECTWGAA